MKLAAPKLAGLAFNVLAYQCAWFACVLGAASGRPFIGMIAVLAAILWHLHSALRPRRELALIGVAAACGAVFETLLAATGWVRSGTGTWGLTPWWMVALWAGFATTLNVSLRGLRRQHLLAALLAAIGAPLAYFAGARLGALQWVDGLPALLAIALGWAMLTPLLMKSALRFDGFATP